MSKVWIHVTIALGTKSNAQSDINDMENTKLLTYEEFVQEILKKLQNRVGDRYQIQHKQIIRNNALVLDGILLQQAQERIVPSIYLNGYYEDYLSGQSADQIIDLLLKLYHEQKDNYSSLEDEISFDFETIKESIYFRLVNYDMNRRLLKDVPHRIIWDLAVTYHCMVHSDGDHIGSVQITTEHCSHWQINEAELMTLAARNTPRLFPSVFRPMGDIMRDMIGTELKNAQDSGDHEQEQLLSDNLEELDRENLLSKSGMYVLTNTRGINGAACLLYSDSIRTLSDKLQGDFYILPSSIHELIVIPDNVNPERDLCRMVSDINQTQVPKEDILSDNIYRYDTASGQIRLITFEAGSAAGG